MDARRTIGGVPQPSNGRLERLDDGPVTAVAVHSRQAPGEPIPAVQLATFKSSRDGVLTPLSATLLAEAARQKPDAVPALSK